MFQELKFIGNLGAAPVVRYTPAGRPVADMTVASTLQINGRDETTWFRVSAWDDLAKFCQQNLSKGTRVSIKGRLTPDDKTGGPRVYKRKNGGYGAQYEVEASEIEPLTKFAQPMQPGLLEPEDDDG